VTAPKIGVVGAADIAHELSGLGFDIITEPGFREAATAISHALKDGPFPLIVADSDTPVVVPWTTVTLAKVSTLVILDTRPGVGILAERPELHLPLPSTFNDLLAKLGYAGAPDPLGTMIIAPDGSLKNHAVTPEPAPLPIPAALPVMPPSHLEPSPAPTFAPAFGAPASGSSAAEVPVPSPAAPVFGAPSPAAASTEPTPAAPTFGAPVVSPIVPGVHVDPAATPFIPAAPVFGAPAAPPLVLEPTSAELPATPVEAALPVAPPPSVPFGGYIPAAYEIDEQTQPDTAPASHVPASETTAPNAREVYTPPVAPPAPTPAWDALVSGAQTVERASDAAGEVAAPIPPAPSAAQYPLSPAQRARTNVRLGAKHGELIFSTAGKGGVGKTSSAIVLAESAAEMGLQAVLIDANRGQADIRKYLRLGDTTLRSAYDAYEHGDPAAAVLKPQEFAHLRAAAKLDAPDFCIVLGPPSDLAGARYASAAIYGDIIDYARSIADVVIVDTQIMEAPEERTDLWRDTVIPMLGGDAWMLGITDESAAGIENLHERLSELRRENVSSARTLILASQFLEFGSDEVNYFQRKFDGLGSFVGNTGVDDDFAMQLNLGKINSNSPSVRPVIDNILLRVTNRSDLFSPRTYGNAGRTKKVVKRGLFGKKKSA